MTWQVPGATVAVAEHKWTEDGSPAFTVDVEIGGRRVAFTPTTAVTLAAALVDASERCGERTRRAKGVREAAIAGIRRAAGQPELVDQTIHDGYGRVIAEGYAADLEGR